MYYTPYIWPFIFSLAVSLWLGWYAFRHRQVSSATTFVWIMAAMSVWTLAYLLELSSSTLADKIFWIKMKYLGSAPGPVLWFVLALQLTHHEHWLQKRFFRWLLTAFVGLVIVMVFSNDTHRWFWTDYWRDADQLELQVAHGFFFHIYSGGLYLTTVISIALYINYYRTTPHIFRQQALLMALGGLIPPLSPLPVLLWGWPFSRQIDVVVLALVVASALFALAIFRFGALNFVHIAHNLVIKNINAGIIVLDHVERVVELNPYARRIINQPDTPLIGKPLKTVLPGWSDLARHTDEERELQLGPAHGQQIYQVQVSAITDSKEALVGYAMTLFDITSRKQTEAQRQRLAALEERERIGRELHDDLGQVMSYVSLQAQTARELLKHGQTASAQATLTQLVQAAQEAHNNVRQYILGVRTATLSSADFTETLQQYLAQLDARHGLTVAISWPDDFSATALTPEIETQLLRIIQEALTNVRDHAGVDRATIFFTLHPDEVQTIIADEGRGFKPFVVPPEEGESKTSPPLATKGRIEGGLSGSEPRKPEGHFGLEITRERAEAVGGSLEVRSTPEVGTQVIVRLPRMLESPPEKAMQGMRALLVDDHALYLDGLKNMLSVRGIQVVGTARDGLEAQALARKLQPDLILMDVEMPRCNGLEATRRIKADLPDTKIVMLTVAADDDTLLQALKNGASGYLLKSVAGREFFILLNQAMQGETVLSPSLAAHILTEFTRPETTFPTADPPAPTLTPRQQEVLALAAQGLSNKEIAAQLNVSANTVKYHVSQILERLHLHSRYELAHYAQQQELGPPPGE